MPLPKRAAPSQRETPEARARRAAVVEELRKPFARLSAKREAKRARRAKAWADRVGEKGGTLDVALRELDREGLLAVPAAGDGYALHRASAREAAAAEAVRPAPALEEVPAADESPEPKKARTRRPAGFAGYIDPRLFDADDWEE